MIQLGRGKDRQIEDTDTAAFQAKTVGGVFVPQQPTGYQEGQTGQDHADQAQFDGDHVPLGRIFQQKCHPEEQDDNTDFKHRITAGEKMQHR